MSKEEFSKIISKLDSLNSQAQKVYYDLIDLNVKDITEEITKKFDSVIQSLQSKFDQIAQVEFYHLVGMANFSASQLMILTKKMKENFKWRAINKRSLSIVNGLKTIDSAIHYSASYKCKVLDVNLKESD